MKSGAGYIATFSFVAIIYNYISISFNRLKENLYGHADSDMLIKVRVYPRQEDLTYHFGIKNAEEYSDIRITFNGEVEYERIHFKRISLAVLVGFSFQCRCLSAGSGRRLQ